MNRLSIKQRVIILSALAVVFLLLNVAINFVVTQKVNGYREEKDRLSTGLEAFLKGMALERHFYTTNDPADIQQVLTFWEYAKEVIRPLEEQGEAVISLINQSQRVLQNMADKRLALVDSSRSLSASYQEWRGEARQMIATTDELMGQAMVAAEDPEETLVEIKFASSLLVGLWSESLFLLNEYLLLAGAEENWQEAHQHVMDDIQTHQENLRAVIMITESHDFTPALQTYAVFAEQTVQTIAHIHQLWQEAQVFVKKMDALKELTSETVNRKKVEYEKGVTTLQRNATRFCLAASGIIIILLIVISLSITVSISHRLRKMLSQVEVLADLDLTKDFDVSHTKAELDVLASHLNTFIREFKHIIGQVQRSGIQVASSSTELSATTKQQEAIMVHQVDAIAHSSNSVKDISDVAEQLVDTMQRIGSMTQETTGLANTGHSDLLKMEEAMRRMEEASQTISGRLEAIREKTENITTVVTTINKVAEQTNLLSLNASIEAEKAGEYGRGFTVVAREIRRLADQTAVATLDIDMMVQEMQSAVSSGIMEMDKFIAEVRHSAENVGRISMQLSLIIDQVQALSPNFEEVNTSMSHQAESAQHVSTTIEQLSGEMQETKISLQETYSAISQLNDAARSMQHEVSRFKVN